MHINIIYKKTQSDETAGLQLSENQGISEVSRSLTILFTAVSNKECILYIHIDCKINNHIVFQYRNAR